MTEGAPVAPAEVALRTVGEWSVVAARAYARPFADVAVTATFTAPSGREWRHPGFYDGHGTWRVRFNPGEPGEWRVVIASWPEDAGLAWSGSFTVAGEAGRGFLRATPGTAWGFAYENGEPAFILGDTVYNLFGMAHCGADVAPFLRRRAEQGFNLLRARLPVSPFHPPAGVSDWQTRRTWPWGGSEQAPLFDEFNLDYFATVDRVIEAAEAIGIDFELIMEAWGFEYPFNSRQHFTAEWEELWLRYLIARYDAYRCAAIWTPLNEYEYYPLGQFRHTPVADRWLARIARWLKGTAAHGHPVAAHNGPRLPPFAERFAFDPGAVDVVLYQEWGTRDASRGWLAAGIEPLVREALAGWPGSAVLAEWGYERAPALDARVPSHDFCDPEHTRRGAWRGIFLGLGIIHGFEHTWGPWQVLDVDQPGLAYLLHARDFVREIMPFAALAPAPDLILRGPEGEGEAPLALASADGRHAAVYLPVVRSTHGQAQPGNSGAGRWRGHGCGARRRRQRAPLGLGAGGDGVAAQCASKHIRRITDSGRTTS